MSPGPPVPFCHAAAGASGFRCRGAAAWLALLLAVVAWAAREGLASPWERLAGMEVRVGERTSLLHAVRFHRGTRELRGRVTLGGVDVAGAVTVRTFNARLMDEVTWRVVSVPAKARVRVRSARGPIVLDGHLVRVPEGWRPFGVEVLVSFTRADGERDEAGLATGASLHAGPDEEALERIARDGRRAVGGLLERSRSPDAGEREFAAVALGRIAGDAPRVVPRLRALLTDTHTAVRAAAAHALGRFGPGAGSAVPALVATFKDPDAHELLKRSALLALEPIGPAGLAAVPDLIEVVRRGSHLHRMFALNALGAVGPAAAAALPVLRDLEASGVTCHNTRTALASAIARIRGP